MEGIAFRAMETPLGDFLLGNRGATVHVAGSVSAICGRGHARFNCV